MQEHKGRVSILRELEESHGVEMTTHSVFLVGEFHEELSWRIQKGPWWATVHNAIGVGHY